MDDEELNDILFTFSLGRKIILNFMKSIPLVEAAKYLKDPSEEKNKIIADNIMNNIIEGYAYEEHSIQ